MEKKEQKIKKEDRAYLYFRENTRGFLNVKFGPDKYSKDTKKFGDVLFTGLFKCLSFLSLITKDEDLEFRTAQYEGLVITLSGALDAAFSDVYELKVEEEKKEQMAVEMVESGEYETSPEMQEKIDMAKEAIKERFNETASAKLEREKPFIKDLEDQIEGLQKALSFIEEKLPKGTPGFVTKDYSDEEWEELKVSQVIYNVIKEKLDEYKDLHSSF